jgi:5'-3' exonuclease
MELAWQTMGRAEADPPTYVAAVFDAPGKTFRHKAFPAYKANRPERPADLLKQTPLMREAARSLGLATVELKGFEADDVIATLATRAKAEGIRTTISSVDKDMCQLVEDGVIELADPVARVRITSSLVVERFGVLPSQVADAQALSGDPVDGIPGVPGVGPKRAAGFIRRFGSIENVIKEVHKGYIGTPAVRQALRREAKNLPTYYQLALLKRDVPIAITFDEMRPKAVTRDGLMEMLNALEAGHLIDRFDLPTGRVMFRRVEAMPRTDHLKWWKQEMRKIGQAIPDIPQCGFYRRKIVKDAEFVACRIWREPSRDYETGALDHERENLMCEVNGVRSDPIDQWGYLCRQPITEEKFKEMIAKPPADPSKPINWLTEPI